LLQPNIKGKEEAIVTLAITCMTCGRSFESEEALREHQRSVHEGGELKPEQGEKEETVA
jgi:hypothetical protein